MLAFYEYFGARVREDMGYTGQEIKASRSGQVAAIFISEMSASLNHEPLLRLSDYDKKSWSSCCASLLALAIRPSSSFAGTMMHSLGFFSFQFPGPGF